MRVEILEYGDNPERDFQEDAESFKVMTVWSEPVTKSVDQIPATAEIHESPEKSTIDPKRIVTAVEFGISQGGFFFIETPRPNPDWLNKVFGLLKDEGWMGYRFNEIRGGCRGGVEVLDEDEFTAVIDHRNQNVFHNRGQRKGEGEVEDVEDFMTHKQLKGLTAEFIRNEEDMLKVELFNGENIWVEARTDLPKELEGEEVILKILVSPGTEERGASISEQGIKSVGDDRLPCKVNGVVTGYDVGDEWESVEHGCLLVELDIGGGKVVIAHENMPPS
jgi:hypothetical protein